MAALIRMFYTEGFKGWDLGRRRFDKSKCEPHEKRDFLFVTVVSWVQSKPDS